MVGEDKEGHREMHSKRGRWYSPSEFEGFGGKTTKNWKKSIQLERNTDLDSANTKTQLEAAATSIESTSSSEFQQLCMEVEKNITPAL